MSHYLEIWVIQFVIWSFNLQSLPIVFSLFKNKHNYKIHPNCIIILRCEYILRITHQKTGFTNITITDNHYLNQSITTLVIESTTIIPFNSLLYIKYIYYYICILIYNQSIKSSSYISSLSSHISSHSPSYSLTSPCYWKSFTIRFHSLGNGSSSGNPSIKNDSYSKSFKRQF